MPKSDPRGENQAAWERCYSPATTDLRHRTHETNNFTLRLQT